METIGDRVKQLIAALGIKKVSFADRIRVSQAFVSQLCSGASMPSDRTIADICREFNVNETWLRTGEGAMFIKMSRDDELAAFFGDVLAGEPDFKRRLLAVLARLGEDEWALLGKMADRLVAEYQKDKADQG